MRAVMVLMILTSVAQAKSKLPATRPADFRLEAGSGGGMVDRSNGLTVTATGCTYTYRNSGDEVRVSFQLTDTELDTLYAAVRDNAFDRIKTKKRERELDAAETRLRVYAKRKSYSYEGREVTDKSRASWDA